MFRFVFRSFFNVLLIIIFHMFCQTICLCLLLIAHSAFAQSPQAASHTPQTSGNTDITADGRSSIPELQSIQQTLLNQYLSNLNTGSPLFSKTDGSDDVIRPPELTDPASIEALKANHNQLMAEYFKNRDDENVDKGVNNTIEGTQNVIQFGTLNQLNGSKNYVDGNSNNVNGNENQIINSSHNIVHGTGNIIRDMPSSQIPPSKPKEKNQIQSDGTVTPSSAINNKEEASASIFPGSQSSRTNLSNQFQRFASVAGLFIVLLLLLQ